MFESRGLSATLVEECDLPADATEDGELPRPPWESLAGIEDVPPDGMLALVLEEVDITAVDDLLLVETIAGWQRVAAWAQLNSALGAAELSRRRSMNPSWSAPAPANRSVAGDELAMRLAWSRRAAERLVRNGRALENELLPTAEAVRRGLVDGPRLRVLTDRLHSRPGELALAVQDAVLPGSSTRTPAQLAADVDRALLEVEPADAADRLSRAVAARHVCHPQALPDGMAGLWAVLPAADAARIDATLEATARTGRALGDPRTLDQLRADELVALATGAALLAGTTLGVEGPARPSTRRDERDATSPPGPPDHRTAVEKSHEPGVCDRREAFGDRDALDRGGTSDEHEDPKGPGGDVPRTSGSSPPRIRIPTVRIDVTVALSTLIGMDERPAELAGFGPISAEQARALAAGGVWRRLVTDPLSGAVLDVGRTRYRPPRSLVEHVVARDTRCAAPGCGAPAHRCDLDHTTEFHGIAANGATEPGRTAAANLGPLSTRCHRLKTDGGFTLVQPAPGVFEWRTPAGIAYRVVPGDHGRTRRLVDPPLPGSGPGYPDEPPF